MTDNPESTQWHALLDRICLERGHHDNLRLAEALSRVKRHNTQAAFDAALKNLANWRQGLHAPSRRNFHALTQILDIAQEAPERQRQWQSLYDIASRRRPVHDTPSTDPLQQPPPPPSLRNRPWLPRAVILLVLIAAASSLALLKGREPASAANNGGPKVIDMAGKEIFWRQNATLKIGESVVVHGRRGPSCGEPPPDWDEVLKYLPPLSTSIWSDGGVGFRVSRACQGPTPARAVVVTATAPGTDHITLYDDPITITVGE